MYGQALEVEMIFFNLNTFEHSLTITPVYGYWV